MTTHARLVRRYLGWLALVVTVALAFLSGMDAGRALEHMDHAPILREPGP